MSDTEKPAGPEGTSAAAGAAAAQPAAPPPPEKPRSGRGGRVSGGLAFIFALIALLGSGYLWYILVYQRPELVRLDLPEKLAALDRDTREVDASLHALTGALGEIEGRVETLAETQRTLKTAIDNLQADIGRTRTQLPVTEAEQLLLVANRRLQLARDVDTALAALHAADRQLERLAAPNLLPVRREIAREIAALQALERADVAGVALRLGSVAERVDRLPINADLTRRAEQTAATQGEEAGSSGNDLWDDLLSLVRVRRHDAPQKPLLPPEQQYFARENLRLMLYGAQHALLRGNVATYEQNLDTARRWLDEYFDAQAAAVEAAREEIARLQAIEIRSELPDISGSLEMLRRAVESRGEAP